MFEVQAVSKVKKAGFAIISFSTMPRNPPKHTGHSKWPWLSAVIGVVFLVITIAGLAAPYLYAEYALRHHGPLIGPPMAATPVVGRWVDDYFVVETIDEHVFGIGEPRYYQANYSYLIVGERRAVLFDAGSGNRDIVRIVRALTSLPVTVVPSHLHFDHVGALGRFEHTALLDDPELRARSRGDVLKLKRYEFLGFADGLYLPKIKVDEWWRAGTSVDLGGRRLTVIHTPGHTPTSLSLYDRQRHLLFCGDFIYPGSLYVFLPGASRSAYLRTAERLVDLIDPSTRIMAAHLSDEPPVITAPRLGVDDLNALIRMLKAIDTSAVQSSGVYPRVFPVNDSMKLATGFAWNNR